MKKIIYRFIISFILIVFTSIIYLSTIGIETKKFNNLIVSKLDEVDPNFNLKINKVSVRLIPFSFAINLKTLGTNLIYKDEIIQLESIRSQISIPSMIDKQFALTELMISTKSIPIINLISLIRAVKNDPKLLIAEQLIENGFIIADLKIEFDDLGNIKKNYKFSGLVNDGEIDLFRKYNLNKINFNFEINEKVLKFNDIKINLNNNDILIPELVTLKKNKKYLVYVPNISVVNIGLLNIFKKQIQIISNTLFCILLYPLFHSELLRKSIIEYDEHYSKTQTYKINQKILNFDKKYFDFEMDVKKKLKDYFFELFNFNYTDKFAAINLRTGSFYKDYEYNLRNSNPKKYLLLINELRKKGFKIICFNNDIKEFQNLNNVMIFPKELKFRKDELEIFILKEANLFITNMFGPKNVASVLGTPSLVCDTFPYSSIIPYNEKDVTIPKIIEKNKIKLSFKEILNNGYFHSLKKEENINLIENTSEDILDGLNQILDKSKINKNYANNRIFKEIMEKEISCIDGLGTISEIFLEKNKYLLD